MRKVSKQLTIFLLLFLVVIATACSSSQTSDDGSDSDSNAGDTIKIGVYLPLSGAAASHGEDTVEAMDLTVEMINVKGLLEGKKLKVIYEDDKGTPEGAVQAINKLLDVDKVDHILGGVLSSNALAGNDITKEKKIHIVAGQSDAITDDGHEWTFAIAGKSSDNATAFVQYANEEFAGENVAAIVEQTDFGHDTAKIIEKAWTGGADTANLSGLEYIETSATSFTSIITKLLADDPKLIYLAVGGGNQSSAILKQLADAGYDGYKGFGLGNLNKTTIKLAGADAAAKSVGVDNYHPELENELNKEYVEKFQEKYGELPSGIMHGIGSDMIRVLAQAIEIAGSGSDSAKIAEALKNNTFDGIIGDGKIDFDENGRNHPVANFYEVSNEGEMELNGNSLRPGGK